MKRITLLSVAILACSLLVIAGCGSKTATTSPDPTKAAPAAQPAAPAVQPTAPAAQEYTCPMHPEVRAIQPGKCPKCGMNLVPMAKPSAAVPDAATGSGQTGTDTTEDGGCACCGEDPA